MQDSMHGQDETSSRIHYTRASVFLRWIGKAAKGWNRLAMQTAPPTA